MTIRLFKKNVIRKNNVFNSDAQHIKINDKYTFVTLFMGGALISPHRISWSHNIDSDMLLPTRPNLFPVIDIKPFEIMNWDQRT